MAFPRFSPGVCVALALVVFAPCARAEQNFQKNNPDPGKFEFARSYISALGQLDGIQRRWRKSSPKKLYQGDDVKIMRGYVSLLIKDDMDLRIAKNYLSPYLESPNALIRKTADTFITACIGELAVNEQEKKIWDQWYAIKSNNLGNRANETAFLNAQVQLSDKRKDIYKSVIEASVLLTKVLRSDRNTTDRGNILAVTGKQKETLLKRLDSFGRGYLDWELKPGQDHIEASVSVIREILEDTIYKDIDE